MQDEEQHHRWWKWKRAPSTACLVCSACRRRVTPCLNCSYLLPFCPSTPCHICRNCKLRNPFAEHDRRVLGLPPPLALPLVMVRRVFIAHVGRPACASFLHMHLQQLMQLLAQDNSHHLVETKERIIEGNNKTFGCYLPFLQCEGLVNGVRMADVIPSMTSCFNYDFWDYIECACVLNADKVSDNQEQSSIVDKVQEECNACCGGCQSICPEERLVNNVVLAHYKEQFIAMQCVEALFNANEYAYPLCKTIHQSSLSIVQTTRCHPKVSSVSSETNGGLSFGILCLANSVLAPQLEAWLLANGIKRDTDFWFENILATARDYLAKRDILANLKRSMLQSMAAKDQAAKDGKVIGQSQGLHSISCWLTQTFSDKISERKQRFMIVAEPFQGLLDKINLVLEFIYSCAHAPTTCEELLPLCTASFESALSIPLQEGNSLIEAARMAATYWLLLYHDIAHGIQVGAIW